MNILLVCAGGMSTSILMKKLEKYCNEKDIPLKINAVGLADYQEAAVGMDVLLLGPQVGYRTNEVQANVNIPVACIAPDDYGLYRCENIIKQAKELISKSKK